MGNLDVPTYSPCVIEDKAQASHGAIAKSRGRGGKYDCESFGSGTALWTLGRSFQVASLFMS